MGILQQKGLQIAKNAAQGGIQIRDKLHPMSEPQRENVQLVETKLFGQLPDETWIYPGHGK